MPHPAPGIVVTAREHVLFVDFTRDRILQLTPDGKVTIFADGRPDRFSVPHHLSLDRDENLYTASDRGGTIWRISPGGRLTQCIPSTEGSALGFLGAGGGPFAIDADGNVFGVITSANAASRIVRVSPRGAVAHLAGGVPGFADGGGTQARFGDLHHGCFAVDPDGSLWVTDRTAIRRVRPDGTVTTLAGGPDAGCADGIGPGAQFRALAGICRDAGGNLWVADAGNGRIRRITPGGVVTTLGVSATTAPTTNPAASLGQPIGVAVGPSGNVYVLDYLPGDRPRVRKLSPAGEILATTNVP